MDGEPVQDANAYAYLRGAASGDLEAIRALVRMGVSQLNDPPAPDASTMIETLIFARMAAAVGTQDDMAALLGLLGFMVDALAGDEGWAEYRDNLQGEAIAIANRLADAGLEVAGEMLIALVEVAGPRASELAKIILGRMGAMEPPSE